QHYGWRASFVVFGALGIGLGIVLHRALREPQRGQAEAMKPVAKLPAGESLKLIFRTPAALMMMAAFVCSNFVAVVLLSWLPTYLYRKFGLNLAQAGLSATIYAQLGSLCGANVGGWAADALVRRTPRGRLIVQAVGVLSGAPFVILCGLTQSMTMVAL